jgi:hypothetical protein
VKKRNLGRWSRRVLRALAVVVIPRGQGAPEVSIDELVDFMDDWVGYMPRLLRTVFPVGLMMLELGAFLLGPSLVPFSFMSEERRARYVDGWVHARWSLRRDLIKGVKGLALFGWYSDPAVAKYLGYQVDEHVQLVAAERLKRYGHELR